MERLRAVVAVDDDLYLRDDGSRDLHRLRLAATHVIYETFIAAAATA
jgi:hypothetical protein